MTTSAPVRLSPLALIHTEYRPAARLGLAVGLLALTACGGGSAGGSGSGSGGGTTSTTAALTATPASLNLVAGGAASTIKVTNGSTTVTATAIKATLTDPLASAVTQDASACASLAPGASCNITFTPGNIAVSATSFAIQGTNTSTASGSVTITSPTSAMISVTPSQLLLDGTYGTAAAGTLTITNTSTVLTATNINVVLPAPLAGVVTENANNCVSVVPGASCTLSFTPTGATAVAVTNVVVKGDNTSQAGASIGVNAAAHTSLTVSSTHVDLKPNGTAGVITITNTGSEATGGFAVDLSNTTLAGKFTSIDVSNCATLAPAASCTITFTPGNTLVADTPFNLAGTNTDAVGMHASITVSPGDTYLGGLVYDTSSGNNDGTTGLMVSPTDVGVGVAWGQAPDIVGTTAQDGDNGKANTAAIVAQYPAGTFAANLCNAYTAGDSSTSAGTWYLPAINQLVSLAQNAAGISQQFHDDLDLTAHWSSTEDPATGGFALPENNDPADYAYYENHSSAILDLKTTTYSVRCIRSF